VRAQFALQRLFRSPNPQEAQQAAELFDDVERGAIEGIYGDDLGVAATIARQRGTVRWELVPSGQDAVLLEGGPETGAPVIIFREQAGAKPRLDRALLAIAAQSSSTAMEGPRVLEELDRGELGGELVGGAVAVVGGLLGQIFGPPPTGPKPPSNKNGPQEASFCQPHTDSQIKGQVYFATLNDELTDDDRDALDRLATVLNSYGSMYHINPFKIVFNGFADPRDALSFPGGNVALSRMRAEACRAYTRGKLKTEAHRSVTLTVRAQGADPIRAAALGMKMAEGGKDPKTLQAQMRVVAVQCDDPLPAVKPQPPAKSDEHARVRCLEALRKTSRFTDIELHRLRKMLQLHVTRFSFLNGMDPELIKIAYGLGGNMTAGEVQAFADRFNVMDFLKKGYIGGSEADLDDTIAGLKQVHQLMEQGVRHLLEGTGKDVISGQGNQRRVKLLEWATAESKRRDSVYFGWSSRPHGLNL
jgi:outer membrane protein OmpA-like peptidoglycan-associated protein